MKNKIIKIYTLILISLFFVMPKTNTYAEDKTFEQVVRFDGMEGYYYIKEDGELFVSDTPHTLKRINDTYYFVDSIGQVYGKKREEFFLINDDSLDSILGKKITYENVKDLEGSFEYSDKQLIIKTAEMMTEDPDDEAIFLNNAANDKYADICVVGDSYAYNLVNYSGKNLNCAVRPGYVISAIKNELLPLINWRNIKYCFVFVGPNDMMACTDFELFKDDLEYITDYIKSKGATPIFASYLGIKNFETNDMEESYDFIIRCNAEKKSCVFVDLEDLDKLYVRADYDIVHPHKKFYKPAFERIYEIAKGFNPNAKYYVKAK